MVIKTSSELCNFFVQAFDFFHKNRKLGQKKKTQSSEEVLITIINMSLLERPLFNIIMLTVLWK